MPRKYTSTLFSAVARIPDSIWGPVVASVLILIVGVIGWAAGRPLLFASLGPTAYELGEKPYLRSAKFYHVVAGHFLGLGAGFLAVALVNAWDSPPVLSTHILTMARVGASTLAIALTLIAVSLLQATHPSAAATTLLVSLGSFRTGYDALMVIIGVLILAVIGETVRVLRLRATGHPIVD